MFPFYGSSRVGIFVSPNGAIHFNPQSNSLGECSSTTQCTFTINGTCTLDSAYLNMLAPFLTDLNPKAAYDPPNASPQPSEYSDGTLPGHTHRERE